MKTGYERFEFYLLKLDTLMGLAFNEPDPGTWLYNNDARTTAFMLESLARLYKKFHNKKLFTKLEAEFKLLEDGIGALDYYVSYTRECKQDNGIPTAVTSFMQECADAKAEALNKILLKRKWMGETACRTEKIRKILSKADWMEEKKEVKALFTFYNSSIKKIIRFVYSTNMRFTEMEDQVHDLRRKLRWLSIYPQALQGVIQLSENTGTAPFHYKYLTPEIVHSPYNVMPPAGDYQYFLLLDRNYFLALSWMIAALGKLKDDGLKIIAVSEALQHLSPADHNYIMEETYKMLGPQHPGLSSLLADASFICSTYFQEKNLDHLVKGISTNLS